jgi:hypothetical protein
MEVPGALGKDMAAILRKAAAYAALTTWICALPPLHQPHGLLCSGNNIGVNVLLCV